MFFTLLVVTFVLALLVSVILVRVFSNPIERILKRIIADAIHEAWRNASQVVCSDSNPKFLRCLLSGFKCN